MDDSIHPRNGAWIPVQRIVFMRFLESAVVEKALDWSLCCLDVSSVDSFPAGLLPLPAGAEVASREVAGVLRASQFFGRGPRSTSFGETSLCWSWSVRRGIRGTRTLAEPVGGGR